MHPLKELPHKFLHHISPALHVWWIRNQLPALRKLAVILLMLLSLFESEIVTSVGSLQAIRCRTSPMPIGRRPEFLSSGISRHARNASKDADWFSMLQIVSITSANALHIFIEIFTNCFHVKFRFQPSASMPDSPAPPWVLTTAFCIFSTSISSNLIGWVVSGVSVNNISWDASFPSG